MSNGTSGDGRLSKNEKREAAREKARLLREEQKKKERRTRFLVQGGVIVAAIAIVAVIALVLVNSTRPPGPGPRNMASDGIQLGQGAVATVTPGIAAGATPSPSKLDTSSGVLDIQIYVDYMCPVCGAFEKANGEYITGLLENGKTNLELHPISFLDRVSQGTKYSTRATNAAACVADNAPDQFYAFHNLLYANQPAENSTGLTDEQLIDLTKQAKVGNADAIKKCIQDQQFKNWVEAATKRASTGPLPNTDTKSVGGTPTVLVNGLMYNGPLDDLASFKAFVVQAAGNAFNESGATPTPTPTPAG